VVSWAVPREAVARIVAELTSRGYNVDLEAATLLAAADDPAGAVDRAVDTAPAGAVVITADHARAALDPGSDPTVSGGTEPPDPTDDGGVTAVETEGSPADGRPTGGTRSGPDGGDGDAAVARDAVRTEGEAGAKADAGSGSTRREERSPAPPEVAGDVTGESTGTGAYGDFVAVFRDRLERLSRKLRSRVNHRPTEALRSMPGGSEAATIGLVDDVSSTKNGHWILDVEDTTGTFPCLVMNDREFAADVETTLHDEVVGVEGTLADDGEILFVDALHFPEVPRNNEPSTADRHVRAALVSDVHVGSQEFRADAWERFADWLHTPQAAAVEYLLIAGDMVEGVGVYPGQDEELDVVDVYEQYERFSEHLKSVPGDLEVVMIPGNHDAVRLAEPQPGFEEDLRGIMSAHGATVTGNPSTVTLEGVSVLMYHGMSLDEVIAEFPEEEASYDHPERAMYHLLRKRHVAPKFGGKNRLAPEDRDYLVVDEVPDVFHTGHVHKLGYGSYRNVLTINSGCWQAQTDFQKSVNIDPDVGYAPIVDLDTLDLTIREFV
jgi:DNA polymerase II small subunit